MRHNKLATVISIIVIWLPTLVALTLWKRIPAQIPIHFNSQMIPDSYGSKAVGIFLLPVILTIAQGLIIFLVANNRQNQDAPEWMKYCLMALIPVISVVVNIFVVSTALGLSLQNYRGMFLNLSTGIVFILIGLVLKQVKPNRTIGIRLPWTLSSEKNWKLTHQFGSRMFLIGGLLLIICGLLNLINMFLFIIMTMILVPCIYSYVLHRRGI